MTGRLRAHIRRNHRALLVRLGPGTAETVADGWQAAITLVGATSSTVPAGNYDVDVQCMNDTNSPDVRCDADR